MKSVGEVMSLGGTFKEAFLKAAQSLEGGFKSAKHLTDHDLREQISIPTPNRLPAVFEALRRGWDTQAIHERNKIDPWFLQQMAEIVAAEKSLANESLQSLSSAKAKHYKSIGLSDQTMADVLKTDVETVVSFRSENGVIPVYKKWTPVLQNLSAIHRISTQAMQMKMKPASPETDRIIVLGNGPNRIGQGLEFDYCCCHAAMAVREAGYTAVMINCNPETVSTDYDTSDKLYFEPITHEHVSEVIRRENPKGVVLQFGGQTP